MQTQSTIQVTPSVFSPFPSPPPPPLPRASPSPASAGGTPSAPIADHQQEVHHHHHHHLRRANSCGSSKDFVNLNNHQMPQSPAVSSSSPISAASGGGPSTAGLPICVEHSTRPEVERKKQEVEKPQAAQAAAHSKFTSKLKVCTSESDRISLQPLEKSPLLQRRALRARSLEPVV